MWSSGKDLFGDEDFIFQDNNASCHRAKLIQSRMTTNKINRMNWPDRKVMEKDSKNPQQKRHYSNVSSSSLVIQYFERRDAETCEFHARKTRIGYQEQKLPN